MSATHSEDSLVAHHFEDLEQQHEAATLGMWLFIAQEIMFFGGLFAAYLVYRAAYPQSWLEASHHLGLTIGTINTLVLLCSSLSMALAARAAQLKDKKGLIKGLIITIILGSIFVIVKYFEYKEKWVHHLVPGMNWQDAEWMTHPDRVQLFFSLYFIMTAMHALHMVIGIGILTGLLIASAKYNKFLAGDYLPVEFTGYYWHFVDIVWVYLFPLLYLVDRFVDLGAH